MRGIRVMKEPYIMQIKRPLQGALLADAILLLAAMNPGSIALAGSGGPPPATHTHYRFTTIAIPEGVDGVFAFGVNDEGLVSGFYADSLGYYHGFLWRDGAGATVDAPGDWADTYLGGGNDLGLAIGNYDDDLTISHAAFYRVWDQKWAQLPDIAGRPANFGNGVNIFGVAVGVAFEGTPVDYYNGVGWIWDGRDYSLISVPQASGSSYGTYASGINDWGQVTGFYQDSAGAYHGFLKQRSLITSFDAQGADDTLAYGINDQGEVVGYYYFGAVTHGLIVQTGSSVTVDVPGADNTQIFGINNLGQIVGWYSDAANPNGYGFIATPIGR